MRAPRFTRSDFFGADARFRAVLLTAFEVVGLVLRAALRLLMPLAARFVAVFFAGLRFSADLRAGFVVCFAVVSRFVAVLCVGLDFFFGLAERFAATFFAAFLVVARFFGAAFFAVFGLVVDLRAMVMVLAPRSEGSAVA